MNHYEALTSEEFIRDAEDCRQLSFLIFADSSTGLQADITYAPLSSGVDVFSQYFLKFSGVYNDSVASGVVEVVENFVVNSEQVNRWGYSVSEEGDFAFRTSESAYDLSRKLDWPKIYGAPQISACLENFQNPYDEKIIEPDRLLDELLITHHKDEVVPHLSLKRIVDVEIEGYDIDFFHEAYSMPVELATTLNRQENSGERLRLDVRYRGRGVLATILAFDSEGNFSGIRLDQTGIAVEQVGRVASFKRAIFGSSPPVDKV